MHLYSGLKLLAAARQHTHALPVLPFAGRGGGSQVVLPAVAENGNAFCYAERVLRHDPNIAFQAPSETTTSPGPDVPNRCPQGEDSRGLTGCSTSG